MKNKSLKDVVGFRSDLVGAIFYRHDMNRVFLVTHVMDRFTCYLISDGHSDMIWMMSLWDTTDRPTYLGHL